MRRTALAAALSAVLIGAVASPALADEAAEEPAPPTTEPVDSGDTEPPAPPTTTEPPAPTTTVPAEPVVATGEVDGATVALIAPPVPSEVVVAVGLPPVPPANVVVAVGTPPVPPAKGPTALVKPVEAPRMPVLAAAVVTSEQAPVVEKVGDVLRRLGRSL